MHQCYQSLSLFCLILCLWLTFVKAQDSELYRQVLGWSTDSVTGCPNNCSGHGQCNDGTTCDCLCGYVGSDCAIESCSAKGSEWFDSEYRNNPDYEGIVLSTAPNGVHYYKMSVIPTDCGCKGLINLTYPSWSAFANLKNLCITILKLHRVTTQREFQWLSELKNSEGKMENWQWFSSDFNSREFWVDMNQPLIVNIDKPEIVTQVSKQDKKKAICVRDVIRQ